MHAPLRYNIYKIFTFMAGSEYHKAELTPESYVPCRLSQSDQQL